MTTLTADLESLWDTERAALIRYMRRRVGPEQAEDLVQNLFLRVWIAVCNGNGATEHAKGWLYRSAHNLVIDYYRDRNRWPEFVELDAPSTDSDKSTVGELIPCDAVQPDELALQAELADEVHDAIGNLTEQQRDVLSLRVQGYDLDEIAAIMDKDKPSVKSLQHRGFTTFHARYQKRFGYDGPRPQRINCAQEVKEFLQEHGPMTRLEITKRLGKSSNEVRGALYAFADLFVSVGKVESMRQEANLWGIVGVHDREAA